MARKPDPYSEIAIEHLKVVEVNYDLGGRKDLQALMPELINQKVSFIISGSGAAIANAIRRVVVMELQTQVLTFDVSQVVTNDREVILEELHDRISFIPIRQDLPEDTTFSINYINNSTKKEVAIVRSKDMVQTGGKRTTELPFSSTWRLISLRPEKYITIPDIRIVRGCGYEHSKFSITSEFEYQSRDYLDIAFLNSRGNIVNRMVSRSELEELLHSRKIGTPESMKATDRLCKPSILIIPDQAYQKLMDRNGSHLLKKYDIIVENAELPVYSSLQADPREFYMKFTTYGTIDPKKMLRDACDNLIARLEYVCDENNLVIKSDGKATKILIRGEDHTIGNILRYTIYKLDPKIGLVNYCLEHPQIRVVTINIIHPEPQRIFHDAATVAIACFQKIKAQIT
jgi:DNA-directed RNA polymerase subunit L